MHRDAEAAMAATSPTMHDAHMPRRRFLLSILGGSASGAAAALAVVLYGCTVAEVAWPDAPRENATETHVDEYRAAYHRAAGERFTGSVSERELLAQLRDARVLWLGDHHRDARLHEAMLALLQRLVVNGLRPVLGTEAIGVQDEARLAAFLRGRIDLPQLRAETQRRWPNSWLDHDGVDAAFYRDLLQLARRDRLPVFALEPTPRLPLARRDREIAGNVRREAIAHRDRLLVVVVGQAHLLGDGDVVRRTGLPAVVLGAHPSPALRRSYADVVRGREAPAAFLRSDRGVLFFRDVVAAEHERFRAH